MTAREILRITDPKDIPLIVDIIHDCKFDKNMITFDPKTSTLLIEFTTEVQDEKMILKRILFLKQYKIPIMKFVLKVLFVENYKIVESSQVGPGSEDFFNKIVYDFEEKKLKIIPIIAKAIDMQVKSLGLVIENTGQVLDEKISLSL